MHTITLNVDNSVYSKFMGLLEGLPKDKVSIEEDNNFPDELLLSKDEAIKKVQSVVNNISKNEGIDIDSAFKKVLSK